MTELVLENVAEGALVRADARLGSGAATVLSSDPAALGTFVAVASGATPPRQGRVLLDGAPLRADPNVRRATATLLAAETLPALRTVAEVVDAALVARGEKTRSRALLEEFGLAAWERRPVRDLDASERRALALALALAHPAPRLLVLYEPFATGGFVPAELVQQRISRASMTGAVTLVATLSLDDARRVGGAPWALDGGVLTSLEGSPLSAPVGIEQTLVVETPKPRELARALAADPAVHGVRWDESEAPSRVFARGSDVEALASAITRLASEQHLDVHGIAVASAPLEALLAARAGAARAHYDLAYRSYTAAAGAPQGYPQAAPPPWAPWSQQPNIAPAPADQSVGMPTEFADPTRPPGKGDGP